jgi:hypothetical protein
MAHVLPTLKIVPLDRLILHERCDKKRVEKLIRRLEEDGFLKNPPIVAEIEGESRFVVLDGANRVKALSELGCRDALVQIVDYDEVELKTWCHMISNVRKGRLLRRLREAGIELERMDRELAKVSLSGRKIQSYILFGDGDAYAARGGGESLVKMADIYGSEGDVHRIEDDKIDSSLRNYDDAVIIFPRYTPREIVELAANDVKLPAGVTRHIIPRRALGLNLDLEILKSKIPLEKKNALLRDLIKGRLESGRVRFYPESTFVFDE